MFPLVPGAGRNPQGHATEERPRKIGGPRHPYRDPPPPHVLPTHHTWLQKVPAYWPVRWT